jgi:AraC family transcriptional regulator of adaptative response/methylated-DNA-[protein]-cysteine methyltransferase
MSTKAKARIIELPILTTDGQFLARYSEAGLCGLEFPSGAKRSPRKLTTAQLPPRVSLWHDAMTKALVGALAGQAPKDLPPFDFSSGTSFQQRVWLTLLQIATGQTWTYAQVAQALGKPKAVRAVGGACGANPIPVLVPCHRVLAANHRLGGFSAGLNWKRTLLKREGAKFVG